MQATSKTIVEELRPYCRNLHQVTLTFHMGGNKTESIQGVYYEQICDPLPGAPNQQKYTRRGFYLASVPKCYIRRKRVENKLFGAPIIVVNHPVCFQMKPNNPPSNVASLGSEWYVACYYFEKPNSPHPAQPFQENCILGQWPAEHGKIDDHERKQYRRVQVEIQFHS